MFRLQRVQAMKRPSKRNQSSLYQMASQNLVAMEGEWILQGDDLVALAHDGEHNWFNVFLEDVLNRFSRKMLLVRSKAPKPSAFTSLYDLLRSVATTSHATDLLDKVSSHYPYKETPYHVLGSQITLRS